MKKGDWILGGSILAVALIFFVFFLVTGNRQSGDVVIRVENEMYGRYSLAADQEIAVNNTNVLTIKDGQAYMKHADCPDQLCVHQKAISRQNESIICLPNQVVISIENGEENEIDTVAH